jgi:hypothetical protein
MFKFWGAEHCIFEDNRLTGDTRGLVLQTHFGVNYQNFIAGNTVERTVLGISKRAADTLLYRNCFQWVRTPVVDKGRQTRQVENTVREDDEYTPERGPIR